jgi:acyl-CoA oxidase
VRLPPTALLGSLKKPVDSRGAFFSKIYRVAIGTIALSSLGIPSLQVASYIASRYSQRRHVVDAGGIPKPIISFQTQKQPILAAVAQSFVLQAMHKQAVAWFMDPTLDPRVRHAVATVHKVAMIQAAQAANLTLGDRCGAQGLYEANQLSAMHVRYLSPTPLYAAHTLFIRSPTCVGSLSPRETC